MEGNTIYTVTENGENRNYLAVDGCSLESVGKLLHRMETIRANLPKGSRLSVLEAMNKRYDFFPLKSRNALLHPLREDEAAEAVSKIEAAASKDMHVRIDFDADRLAFLYEHDGEVHELTAPAAAFTEAYTGSLRKKNASQTYVNYKYFEGQLEKICEGRCLSSPSEQAGQDETQAPKMSL
jgi:hypothetical protein